MESQLQWIVLRMMLRSEGLSAASTTLPGTSTATAIDAPLTTEALQNPNEPGCPSVRPGEDLSRSDSATIPAVLKRSQRYDDAQFPTELQSHHFCLLVRVGEL